MIKFTQLLSVVVIFTVIAVKINAHHHHLDDIQAQLALGLGGYPGVGVGAGVYPGVGVGAGVYPGVGVGAGVYPPVAGAGLYAPGPYLSASDFGRQPLLDVDLGHRGYDYPYHHHHNGGLLGLHHLLGIL